MTDYTCSVEECATPRRAKGFCDTHYRRWKKYGDPSGFAPKPEIATCAIDGCERTHYAKGWCARHYGRWQRHGDPTTVVRSSQPVACSVTDCDGKRVGWGLCGKHYRRFKNTGSTEVSDPRFYSPEESFAARTKEDGDCTVWTGWSNRLSEYGYISVAGKNVLAHRYAWERVNGPIPDGNHVDHLCWNRTCVKVEHLRLVTQAQNNQNLSGPQAGSKSGIRGVHWVANIRKWRASATAGGRTYYAGTFADKEEAGLAAAKLRAEVMTHSQN